MDAGAAAAVDDDARHGLTGLDRRGRRPPLAASTGRCRTAIDAASARRPCAAVRLRAGRAAPPPLRVPRRRRRRFPFDDGERHARRRRRGDARDARAAARPATKPTCCWSPRGRRLGGDAAVAAIRAAQPDLHAVDQRADRRPHAARAASPTSGRSRRCCRRSRCCSAFLLITVLLTVSVNQRLGEIAALRALGFSRARVVADVLCESALLVGAGGVLALPLGVALSLWLDRILKTMPGIPAAMHFFVFEPRALVAARRAAGGHGAARRRLPDVARGARCRLPRRCATRWCRMTRRSSRPAALVKRVPMAGRAGPRAARRVAARSTPASTSRFAARRAAASRRCCTCSAASTRRPRGTLLFDGRDVGALPDARAQPAAAAQHRLRVSALLPAADADRGGERRAAAGRSRRRRRGAPAAHARAARLRRSRPSRAIIARRSCRAARCSGWRSPARWPTGRGCCSPTSRPASSIGRPASRSRRCSIACSADGTAVVVVTHDPALAGARRAPAADARRPHRARGGAT